MCLRHFILSVLIAPCVIMANVRSGQCDDAELPTQSTSPDSQATRRAVERGLEFLERDVVSWRQEHECATCHHGVMTVWAYNEAKRQGYAVHAETVAETVKWAKEQFLKTIDKPRDTRPGWKMVSTPAIYFSLMTQFVDNQDAFTADELERIAGHLIRHQEADGSWAWSSAPPVNRPPPFFESDEVATRLAYMALAPYVPADPTVDSTARDSRAKAEAWLEKTAPAETTQAAALRLLMKVPAVESGQSIEEAIGALLTRRNEDGGWGQLQDLPSDAYATGQALYVLSLAGVQNDRHEIRQAVAFLIGNQREDGSWPMTSRSHPDAAPYKNPVPITYFGSAWATIGLMRSVPNNLEK